MSLNLKWPGSGSAISGSTPFGLYDLNTTYQIDGPKTAVWCAKRLGYPIIDVELIDENMYACFEEATSEYSAQVNQFNIRNNLDIVKGQPVATDYTQKLVDGTIITTIFRMSQAYGTLAGVGGPTDIKKAYIIPTSSVQEYDLMLEAVDVNTAESFSTKFTGSAIIDVTRVYYEQVPAITRFFDPYSVGAQGTLNLLSEFGFGNFSPSAQFLLMPLYEDLLRIQQIELNDQIRKSAHTFNIVNNKLLIFPIPEDDKALWFEYMVHQEFTSGSNRVLPTGYVSDYSNIGYDFATYGDINDVGIQWIRKYALALVKELLGAIREKYSSIPIPGSEVSLDGASLRAEA